MQQLRECPSLINVHSGWFPAEGENSTFSSVLWTFNTAIILVGGNLRAWKFQLELRTRFIIGRRPNIKRMIHILVVEYRLNDPTISKTRIIWSIVWGGTSSTLLDYTNFVPLYNPNFDCCLRFKQSTYLNLGPPKRHWP